MDKNYLEQLKKKRAEAEAKKARELELKQTNETVTKSGEAVAFEVVKQNAINRQATQKVKVENEDLAKKQDIDAVIAQLKEVQLASLLGGQSKPSVVLADSTDLGERIGEIAGQINNLATSLNNDDTAELKALGTKFDSLSKAIKELNLGKELASEIKGLKQSFESIDVKPVVNVPTPKVTVQGKDVDLSPLEKLLGEVKTAINGIKLPKQDNSDLKSAIEQVSATINGLSFPVPNYVLPFKDSDGKAVQQEIVKSSERLFERVSNTDGNSTASTTFAAASGKKNYIRGYSITNTSSTNGYVDFRDGTSGSVLWTVPIPANGGANVMLEEPIFWTSANTALAYDVSGALTTVYISVTGYQA